MTTFGRSLSTIKHSVKTHRKIVTIKSSKLALCICKKLFKLGYISGFFSTNLNTLTIVFKNYLDTPVFTDVKLFYNSGNKRSYTLNRLFLQLQNGRSNQSSVSILSTSKGVLTHKECFLNRVSGSLLMEIY